MSYSTERQSLYLAGSFFCCFLFVLLTILVKSHTHNLSFNVYLYQYIEKELQIPLLKYLAIFVSLFGDKFVVIPTITLTCIILFFKQQKRFALHLFAAIILAALLAYLLKNIFAVPRPGAFAYVSNKYAFPSRHVALFSTYSIFLFTTISKTKSHKWQKGLILFLLIALESLSRIVLGVHWLTDVVGGFLLGTACGLIGAYRYYFKPALTQNLYLLFKTMILVFCGVSIIYLWFFWSKFMHEYRIAPVRSPVACNWTTVACSNYIVNGSSL